VPVILAEDREIELREGVAPRYAAHLEDGPARAPHKRLIAFVPRQLAGEIGLYGAAYLRRTAGESGPIPVTMLFAADIVGKFAKLLGIPATEKLQEQYILALEDGIPFKLRDPMAIRLLPIQQPSL
jgi:hypothetical protein